MPNFPKRMLLSNMAWVANRLRLRTQYFKQLAKGQTPQALWIGCSDSRVPAEEITGVRPGDLFVHRNIANVIKSGDIGLNSVLYYSLIVLKVKHIIVCGHSGCGGVLAAIQGVDQPDLKSWLNPVTDLVDQYKKEANPSTEAELSEELVRRNVFRGIQVLGSDPIVKQAWDEGSLVSIHGWVYGLDTGLLDPVGELNSQSREKIVHQPTSDIRILNA